jgi:hypothetical protein
MNCLKNTPSTGRGLTDQEQKEMLAVSDILAENAEDFLALMKLKGMTSDMPGYVAFAKRFAQNVGRDQRLRQQLAG